MYTNGEYLNRNPTWHVEHSSWKARQILKMLARNHIEPRSVCEVGCGAGEILRQLQLSIDDRCIFHGYEISPQAFELCKPKANTRLKFHLKDILLEEQVDFDVILLIDVIEHLEDYFGFLRKLRSKSRFKILHIPLGLTAQAAWRVSPIIEERERLGHLHFFDKYLALKVFELAGYQVVDYFYTPWGIELAANTLLEHGLKLIRRIFLSINQDLGVRVLGGCSLMVLVQ